MTSVTSSISETAIIDNKFNLTLKNGNKLTVNTDYMQQIYKDPLPIDVNTMSIDIKTMTISLNNKGGFAQCEELSPRQCWVFSSRVA